MLERLVAFEKVQLINKTKVKTVCSLVSFRNICKVYLYKHDGYFFIQFCF